MSTVTPAKQRGRQGAVLRLTPFAALGGRHATRVLERNVLVYRRSWIFLVFMKLKIAKTYDAMLATPLGVGDVALGELSWCVLRGALYTGAFLVIMTTLGYVVSPWAILCWPAAILISLAFASAGMAGTTYMRTWQDFDMVSLAFIPLFLFSATFYPLTVFPGWLQAAVRCTPLYQGVVIVRAADLGIFFWVLLLHIAYLAAMAIGGVVVTRRRLGRLLLP